MSLHILATQFLRKTTNLVVHQSWYLYTLDHWEGFWKVIHWNAACWYKQQTLAQIVLQATLHTFFEICHPILLFGTILLLNWCYLPPYTLIWHYTFIRHTRVIGEWHSSGLWYSLESDGWYHIIWDLTFSSTSDVPARLDLCSTIQAVLTWDCFFKLRLFLLRHSAVIELHAYRFRFADGASKPAGVRVWQRAGGADLWVWHGAGDVGRTEPAGTHRAPRHHLRDGAELCRTRERSKERVPEHSWWAQKQGKRWRRKKTKAEIGRLFCHHHGMSALSHCTHRSSIFSNVFIARSPRNVFRTYSSCSPGSPTDVSLPVLIFCIFTLQILTQIS